MLIEPRKVLVHAMQWEAQGVVSVDMRPLVGASPLPAFEPGAHIDVDLGGGLVRSYSLINPQDVCDRYRIAVRADPDSRGGSRFIHETLRVGHALTVGAPRNHFPLAEAAARSVFIAGGIGITPIWGMIQRLDALGATWTLHYANRTRARAAFLGALSALPDAGARVRLVFDDELVGSAFLDIASVVSEAPPDAHLYCCGPPPMMAAFVAAAAGRPRDLVHLEYFTGVPASGQGEAFVVELARSKLALTVPPGSTILDVILEAGVDAPCSCREGVCGVCEVRVLAGLPDHKDFVLTPEEAARNDRVIICCSGSRGSRLVIDL